MLNEVLLKMKDIEYGYLYQGEDISETEDLAKYYTLNSPEKTIKDKMGVCWDQVELERKYFNELNKYNATSAIASFSNVSIIVGLIVDKSSLCCKYTAKGNGLNLDTGEPFTETNFTLFGGRNSGYIPRLNKEV